MLDSKTLILSWEGHIYIYIYILFKSIPIIFWSKFVEVTQKVFKYTLEYSIQKLSNNNTDMFTQFPIPSGV
jgi:hypothetical protein